jgi:hypothetical protein
MTFDQKKIAREQIWKYLPLEQAINQQVHQTLDQKKNIAYRIVDSVFAEMPTAWTDAKLVVTDNIPTRAVCGQVLPLYPEYWHVYHYQPVYQSRPATYGYNCFMNRVSEDRGQMFQELKCGGLLSTGLVSFNNLRPGNSVSTNQDLLDYGDPYNNLTNSLEQSIIDSNISVVLETYISDDHITFSEKIFRALQLPRPWLLYCSPQSVKYLRHYGFDILDDYVDHSYDNELSHSNRLLSIVDQLERFVNQQYNKDDYARFEQAAEHNRNLLLKFAQAWPIKFDHVLKEIEKYD